MIPTFSLLATIASACKSVIVTVLPTIAVDAVIPIARLEVPAPIKDLTSAALIPVFKDGAVPFDKIAGTPCSEAAVIYPAPLVIALLFKDMFAEPLKLTPAIFLAVCNTVAEPAFPVIVVWTTLLTTPKLLLAPAAVLDPVPPLATAKSAPPH